MIKKIILGFILCIMIFSCGKKGDPNYKESKNKEETQNILKNKV